MSNVDAEEKNTAPTKGGQVNRTTYSNDVTNATFHINESTRNIVAFYYHNVKLLTDLSCGKPINFSCFRKLANFGNYST